MAPAWLVTQCNKQIVPIRCALLAHENCTTRKKKLDCMPNTYVRKTRRKFQQPRRLPQKSKKKVKKKVKKKGTAHEGDKLLSSYPAEMRASLLIS